MNNEYAIVAENLTKTFKVNRPGSRTLKSAVLSMLGGKRRCNEDFKALDGVTFNVKRGETLGIIGANGAGKSTLLSIIAGTMYATSGSVKTTGAISSLLELGAGLHPDLSGRENIYLYGAIMGISRQQMKTRFEAIVDFAGLWPFIDQPVRHYSSGMYVRLGFAVAVEVDPDILLIDEVLAVGDSAFQRKCLDRMNDFKKKGKTMLIISHDIPTIQSISDRILLLDSGRIAGMGDAASVVNTYQTISRTEIVAGAGREWGTGEMKITGVEFRSKDGVPTGRFRHGESLEALISYETSGTIEKPVFGFALCDASGRVIYGNNTQIENFSIPHVSGKGTLILKINSLSLASGNYLFSVAAHSEDHRTNYHRIDHRFAITVEAEKPFEGSYMDCTWNLKQ